MKEKFNPNDQIISKWKNDTINISKNIIDSNMHMNKKYAELNELIKKWYSEGSQDISILKSVFAQVNLEHNELADGNPDLKGGTKYSEISTQELVNMFEKETFNKMSKTDLTHLMQEAHNRFINENGFEVTRNVVVKDDNPEDEGICGYVYYHDDLLFINKDMIDTYSKVSQSEGTLNTDTIGKFMLDTVWHETKHIIQYEDGMDFVMGKEQDLERAFTGALMIINNSNFVISQERGDYSYLYQWKAGYRNHFYEHEANYVALKKVIDNVNPEIKNTTNFDQYVLDSSTLALNFKPSLTDDIQNQISIKSRIAGYENFLRFQLGYFDEGTRDCPIKRQIMKVMREYLKTDENGNNLFRERLTREITDFVNIYSSAKKHLNKVQKDLNVAISSDDSIELIK